MQQRVAFCLLHQFLKRSLEPLVFAVGEVQQVLLLRLERAFGRAALRQELWAEEESSPGSSLRSFAPGAQTSEQLQSNCSPEQSPLEGSGGSCQAQASNEEQLHAPGTDKAGQAVLLSNQTINELKAVAADQYQPSVAIKTRALNGSDSK